MITNVLLYNPTGPLWLILVVGISTMLWMTQKERRWYAGVFCGCIIFATIVLPFRPPAHSVPMSDSASKILFQNERYGKPRFTKRFFCNDRMSIAFPAQDEARYILINNEDSQPIPQSHRQAMACYQKNRHIF